MAVKMCALLIVLLCVALCAVPAMAGGINITGADVGPALWTSFHGGEAVTGLDLTLHPFPTFKAPATPTNRAEIIPWAIGNLGLDIFFEGNQDTLLRVRGVGVSEQVKLAQVGPFPVRGGVGYLVGPGFSWFVKGSLLEVEW